LEGDSGMTKFSSLFVLGILCASLSLPSRAQIADPDSACVEPTQAKTNLRLFEAIESTEAWPEKSAQIKKVINQGAALNCAFPTQTGENHYGFYNHFDLPSEEEVKKTLATPVLTDPWAVLAAKAPLTSFVVGSQHLQKVLRYTTDKATWEARAQAIREAILKGAQLDPLPPKTPLNPIENPHVIIHNECNRVNQYMIKNVAFEATPGFLVTGNLFIPLNKKGPFPGILVPHGHFGRWAGYARTLPENQILCTRLAEMGAVVFTYDMVGWGDSQQLNHPDFYGFWVFGNHTHFKDGTKNNLLALQLWDSIRAVDYLGSLRDENERPLVDCRRIGVTGASGGGTQALYLAAVDPRIAAASLVVIVAAGHTGNDYCEDGMPVYTVEGQRKTNNTEIAATFAPKPMLFISDGHDWTRWFPKSNYPYIKKIWGLYDMANRGLNFHFPGEYHDYKRNKRDVVYDFFGVAFGLPKLPADAADGDAHDNDEGVDLEPRESLKVFTADFPRPNVPMRHLEPR
jgi:dienelactone hydrolase